MIEEPDDPQDQAAPAEGQAPGPLRKGWHPLAWLLVGTFALFVPFGLAARIASFLGPLARLTLPVLAAGLAIVTYRVLMQRLARRAIPELEAGRWPLETLLGIGTGGALAVGSAFIVTLLGGYRFIWAPSPPLILFAFLAYYFSGAIVEELVFRGLAFQAIEQMGGRWTALVVTSIFFGAIHFCNPNATFGVPSLLPAKRAYCSAWLSFGGGILVLSSAYTSPGISPRRYSAFPCPVACHRDFSRSS